MEPDEVDLGCPLQYPRCRLQDGQDLECRQRQQRSGASAGHVAVVVAASGRFSHQGLPRAFGPAIQAADGLQAVPSRSPPLEASFRG